MRARAWQGTVQCVCRALVVGIAEHRGGGHIGGHHHGLCPCSFMSRSLRTCSLLPSQVALTLNKCLMSIKCLQGV